MTKRPPSIPAKTEILTSKEISTLGLDSSFPATTNQGTFGPEGNYSAAVEVTTLVNESSYSDITSDIFFNSSSFIIESVEQSTAAYPVSSGSPRDITSYTSTLTSELSQTTQPSSSLDIVALAVGVGLGVALLVAIIIIIILCVKLSRAKGEKLDEKNISSSKAFKKDQFSANNGAAEPNLDYSSTYSNYDIDKSTLNRESLYAPSSLYEYASYVGTTTIPQSNGTNNASKKSKTPPVIYAIVNKVKPNKNVSARNLANPCDDVVIIENDLYTADVGVGH